ncbi:hypothetical protein TWF569_010146 [Orbilia oligospora]|uniref:Peptidase A1 domain-containing protein n=1 Tax=Orbilia oligospora TaxID=2813651 RepID=A0A7C8N5Q1_ORBOL|nr:hypothetical protein TWF103_002699 [Orbilia oligospora]KAF3084328.1 hypothetical protein TWF102_011973 [Orbilia oligospora]KAF3099388.1 hypothetical protein TWF706_006492 [Orbilia oligospora]KAF3134569.1 hypothetical protein TWF569_010146 [Orbilia oligospora]
MPTLSTLRTLTLALVVTIKSAQATVVVPYVTYIGPGPIGVPDEFVRYPMNETEGMYQGRFGVHLAIGTPPQHVWVPPHFFSSETYVKGANLCDNYTTADPGGSIEYCESNYNGLFAANESSTFEMSSERSFGVDTVTVYDAVPDLENDEFRFGIQTTEQPNVVGEDLGILGLGPNSTFLQTFFPGKEQVGIYYTGGSSTHGKPPYSTPPRPLVVYELEFDGYNQSHFTGEKFTQPIGPPAPLSNSSNPFTLTVTNIAVGRNGILGGGGPFVATVDFSGRTSNILPSSVYNLFVQATGARIVDGMPSYNSSTLPTDPDDFYDLAITFSDGSRDFTVSLPQEVLISQLSRPNYPDFAMANILNADDPVVMRSWPVRGPVIALNQLMFTSYIGIDHAAGEWWLAKAVHPWDEAIAPTNNNTSKPKEGAAAGGIGGNLKRAIVTASALTAAVILLC